MDAIIYDKIDEVQGKVEYNGGGINSLKQDTAALLAKGVVKSVQRGHVTISARGDGITQHINISAVDPNKAIVAVSSEVLNSADVVSEAVAYSLTSTGFQIDARHTYGSYQNINVFASWQVIEFY